jgi:hypothetical protein
MSNKPMTVSEALHVVSRYHPCGHYTVDLTLGDGKTWAKCEDCGQTFHQNSLSRYQEKEQQFEQAIEVLRLAVQPKLVIEGYEESVVSDVLHWRSPQSPEWKPVSADRLTSMILHLRNNPTNKK